MPEAKIGTSLEKQEYVSVVLYFIVCIWLLFHEASVNPSDGKAAGWEMGQGGGELF